MYGFRSDIQDEIKTIQKLIKLINEKKYKLPKYKLICKTQGNRTYYRKQFYYIDKKGEKKRASKYIGLEEKDEVIKYKISKYQLKRLMILKEDLKLLRQIEKKYKDYSPEIIQNSMPKTYRLKALDCNVLDETKANKSWQNYKLNKQLFSTSVNGNLTCDGTQVDSKGEVIIYDILMVLKIDFAHSKPLCVVDDDGNQRWLKPDFTIRTKSGKLIIIEHEGLLGDIGYRSDKLIKLGWYQRAGFILGKNFFLTSDDVNGHTDSQAITRFITNLILPLVEKY